MPKRLAWAVLRWLPAKSVLPVSRERKTPAKIRRGYSHRWYQDITRGQNCVPVASERISEEGPIDRRRERRLGRPRLGVVVGGRCRADRLGIRCLSDRR